MSDRDRMVAFGTWLVSNKAQTAAEMYALSTNATATIDRIRIKAGHLEKIHQVYAAFCSLFDGDVNAFKRDYLGELPENEENKESSNEFSDA